MATKGVGYLAEKYRSRKYNEQSEQEVSATLTPRRMDTYRKQSRRSNYDDQDVDENEQLETTRRVQKKSPRLIQILTIVFVLLVFVTLVFAIQ